MDSLRVIRMAALAAGMAGVGSAQITASLTASPASPITYGQPLTLIAYVNSTSAQLPCTGESVAFQDFADGASLGTAQAVLTEILPGETKCTATLTPNSYTSSLKTGQHTLIAAVRPNGGNPDYSLVVNPASPVVTLALAPNPSTPGQTVTLTATAAAEYSGGPAPTGSVTFTIDGNSQPAVLLSNGVATQTTATLTAGTHSVNAIYEGDGNYNSALPVNGPLTQTVNRLATATFLQAVPTSSTYGQGVALTAAVSPPTATGTVTFKDGSTSIGTASLIAMAGIAILPTSTLSVGSHSLTASYNGDANYASSVSSAVTETVNPPATVTSLQVAPTPSTPGQPVALTATVSPPGATGTVTFLDGSTPIGTAPLIAMAGIAVFVTSNLSSGSHSLTASYGGDPTHAPSVSAAVTETVSQNATATSLKAVPTSSSPGQNVTLTATVSPSGATGTVSFLDGLSTIGTAALNTGTASFNVSTLTTGNHSLTASYGGDANDAASTSPAVTVSVGLQPTTTVLSVRPNPAAAGQSVTLTATVTPGNPTGTVSFYDGANLLGSSAVAAAAAVFSTATLTAGSHSLTATYSGDTNNAASTSAAVAESVTGGTGTAVPNPVSVSPVSGSGSGQVMIFTFNDPSGWQDLDVVNILIGNFLDGRNACYLAYSRTAGVLYLVADDGGTLSAGLTLGGSGSVSNSQCSVAGAASSAAGSGDTLTVTLNTIFTAGFGGNKVVYMAARSVGGGNSGWQALGVWQAPFTPAGTITVVSLTPARGAAAAGTAQTFTAVLTDSRGTGDFGVVNLLVNNFIDGRNACYLAYAASTNSLLLVDDGGDAGGPFAGTMVLNGAVATMQNSQCSVNGGESSAVKSGGTLVLTMNIMFQTALDGNRIVWVAGRDGAGGNNTDWQAMGTTTVQ